MKDIYATTYVSLNENGREEVSIEYHKTYFQTLFNLSSNIETYEFHISHQKHLEQYRLCGIWRNKKTGKKLTHDDGKFFELEYFRDHNIDLKTFI